MTHFNQQHSTNNQSSSSSSFPTTNTNTIININELQPIRKSSGNGGNGVNGSGNGGKIILPGYNYSLQDVLILNNNDGGIDNNNGNDNENKFNTILPIELQPFFNSPNEFRSIVKSVNLFKSKSNTTFTILLTLHFIVMIPFLFILIFFGVHDYQDSSVTPFYVGIVLVFVLLVSIIVMITLRSKYIKKDFKDFHKHLTNKYSSRGLEFKCTLILMKRNKFSFFKVVYQTQLIINYPHRIIGSQQSQLSQQQQLSITKVDDN